MTRRILPLLLIAICLIGSADARRHKPKTLTANEPGKFDYYVLSLSWSPEHCATTHDTSTQCAGTRHFGFVVHGLWPQFEHGFPHEREWLDACKGSKVKPGGSFEFSGMVTETLLLGNVATRWGQKLNWDRANMKVVNAEAAQKDVRPERRSGWEL